MMSRHRAICFQDFIQPSGQGRLVIPDSPRPKPVSLQRRRQFSSPRGKTHAGPQTAWIFSRATLHREIYEVELNFGNASIRLGRARFLTPSAKGVGIILRQHI
ncbi:hypothetical protein [Brucella melitensis]|uniref:hypothetical protein n=1 Tax=Brucella melitensis TaxID=29459 RepID=UPI0009B71BAD